MTNLEYIILCLLIPVAYITTYIAGEKQVIETKNTIKKMQILRLM